jgi:hypothetical protein
MAAKTSKKETENPKNESLISNGKIEKSNPKIRSFRELKLKVLKGEKLTDFEISKINERIIVLKAEIEKLKSKLSTSKKDLEELEIIIKFHK